MGILQRTIFWELARVFVFSLVGITGLIVMAAIVVEASQRGLGPAQILAAIPLIVPSMMPFIIPPTTLFATCVVYGRLAHDNEIIAIKAAGINILHVVWPGVFLGVAMSATTLGLYLYLIPYTHHLLRTAVVSDVEEFLYSMLKRDREIKGRMELKLDYEMWAEDVQGRLLKHAIFMRKDAKGNYDVIASAREAELRVDMIRGEVLVQMRNCRVLDEGGRARGNLENRIFAVPLPAVDQSRKLGARDMTWQELLQSRRKVATDEAKYAAEAAKVELELSNTSPANADLKRHFDNLKMVERDKHQRLLTLDTELQMRPALSFGCLFFVLIGCPVGIWISRSDYLSAFITCFLPIVFLYYPLQLCCTNLAKDGKLEPVLALWAANAAMGLIALMLFRRLLKN